VLVSAQRTWASEWHASCGDNCSGRECVQLVVTGQLIEANAWAAVGKLTNSEWHVSVVTAVSEILHPTSEQVLVRLRARTDFALDEYKRDCVAAGSGVGGWGVLSRRHTSQIAHIHVPDESDTPSP
jgi:hypothetical protein